MALRNTKSAPASADAPVVRCMDCLAIDGDHESECYVLRAAQKSAAMLAQDAARNERRAFVTLANGERVSAVNLRLRAEWNAGAASRAADAAREIQPTS